MEEFPLENDEQVVRRVRKHWFVLVMSLLPFVFLAWLPTFLPELFERFIQESGTTIVFNLSSDNPWVRLTLGLWWLLMWVGAFSTFTQYYLNHWVITTMRIVRVRQYGFFSREVSSFLLSRVQDVSTTVNGVFADLLRFGLVRVQTAGTESDQFTMDGIADPTGMRDLIIAQIADLNEPKAVGV